MANKIVVGAQWGDEGKGKITNMLARTADVVVRYGGGNNAGHTVIVGEDRFELHLIPSGILYPEKQNIIANGVVVDPEALVAEMKVVEEKGVSFDKFFISETAHVIMPYHRILDMAEERRKGAGKIGTTGKGIGPAYTDKIARRGIRFIDTLDKDCFYKKLSETLDYQNLILERVYGEEPLKASDIIEEYEEYIDILRKRITNTAILLEEAYNEDKNVFFEGAQGTLLDVDYGTYPFVTSSNPTAGGVCTGSGFGPTRIDDVIGVAKAYITRVGEGPFPTELNDETGKYLREKGHEYGVTTGRPRRCGWFDIPIIKHACRVNGLTEIALTKLDVLTGIEEIKVCTAYKYRGKLLEELPLESETLSECKPVYTSVTGWHEDISGITSYEKLPGAVHDYIELIEDSTGVKITVIGTGPEREEAVIR